MNRTNQSETLPPIPGQRRNGLAGIFSLFLLQRQQAQMDPHKPFDQAFWRPIRYARLLLGLGYIISRNAF